MARLERQVDSAPHREGVKVSPIRRVVATLRDSLETGGIQAMAEAHDAALVSDWSYRLFSGLLDLAYPVSSLLDLFGDLDRRIAEVGMADAAKELLATVPTSWSADFPPGEESRIRGEAVVVFGKHGSILTPFLVAASLNRPDMKMVGASYVAKLGPTVASLMFPVSLPIPTLRGAARKGLLIRVGAWLTAKLDRPAAREVTREGNRAALTQAADHVRSGGSLLIAPDARGSKEKWRPGIGLLVSQLARDESGEREMYLVPYRIWASITGIFHLLSRNPLLRALGRWEYRRPIRVAFGEPIPVKAVIARTGPEPIAITDFLERHYRGLGF